jgi:hypothetical protein
MSAGGAVTVESAIGGSHAPVPPPEILGPWLRALEERLEAQLPSGGVRSREGYGKVGREPVDMEVRPDPDGDIGLRSLRVAAFWLLTVPRVWDDPRREAREPGIERELDSMCRRFRAALDLWTEAIAALGRHLDYTPPGSAPAVAPPEPESVN